MPNRVIKEAIWTSPNLNQLSCAAERHFYRLIPCPDDHGCFESTPRVIKGKCYPLQDTITLEDIIQWQNELEANNIIIQWSLNGRDYSIFPTLHKHQQIRSLHKRKTPEPPIKVVKQCNHLITTDSNEKQPLSDDNSCCYHPNPNPNPNPNLLAVFNLWNDKEIIRHRDLVSDIEKAIQVKLKQYKQKEICQAIENYAEIVHGKEYYWSYKWTLKDFLKRGFDKFIDGDVARQNYKVEKKGKKPDVELHRDFDKELGITDEEGAE